MLAFIPIAGMIGTAGRLWPVWRQVHLRAIQCFCRWACRFTGIEIVFENRSGLSFTGRDRTLFVANHMSYLDILAMAAHLPAFFVTSREFQKTPFLGWICAAGGCFFVERRNRSTVQADISAMATRLTQRFNVAFFPEGTTSDGGALLPFKRTLLEAALRSKARVVPVCINYQHVNGTKVTRHNRDVLAWYGDMTFVPHFLKLLTLKRAAIQVTVLPLLPCRVERNRKKLGEAVQRALREDFQPIS